MWSEDDGNDRLEGFDTAQVCMNGHVINACSQRSPEFNQKHCDECGARTITICQLCESLIRGLRMNTTILGGDARRDTVPPSFYYECGAAYPWVKDKLDAARELADILDDLNETEKEQLKLSLDALVKDSAKTPVAAMRFKQLVAKAGQGTADAFREILVSVVVEAARKQVWPTG